EYTDIIVKKIKDKLKDTASNDDKDKWVEAEKMLLSAAALIYFSSINEWNEFFGVNKDNEQNSWSKMLEKMIDVVENAKNNNSDFNRFLSNSTLFDFSAWKMISPDDKPQPQHISILDIINIKKKYAIILA
ncbi:hypothetical protein, partial [Helicobacter sp. UBA3407]|uniref:hypothetical protein n=1 Tax=Helicobacter sp. UBA3407 TaxID=1946588 RepID=UPI0026376E08